MAERQQTLAHVILKDPAVESLSSFIGVDGTNTTLNSGRIQINLISKDKRDLDASGVIRRLQSSLAEVQGISLYMQPVQDLSIEDRVSRTQFQFTLESADSDELGIWTRRLVERLGRSPHLADVASDLQDQGLQAYVDIDRDAAGRMGITAAIDNILYDAYGQRLVSTIFTQSNQYRVVLEVKPDFKKGSRGPERFVYILAIRYTGAAGLHRENLRKTGAAGGHSSGSVLYHHLFST